MSSLNINQMVLTHYSNSIKYYELLSSYLVIYKLKRLNISNATFVFVLMLIVSASLFSQSITSTINLPAGSKPTQICVDEQSNKIYVTDNLNARVFEIDGVSKSIEREFHVPTGPSDCIVNSAMKKVYTFSSVDGSAKYFSVINLNTGIVDSFYTNNGYFGMFTNFALHPSMDKVYFLVMWDLYVYNGITNVLSKVKSTSLNAPLYVEQIGIDTVMKRVYVPNGGGNVMVVNCMTDSVISTIQVDPEVYARVNVAAVNQLKSLLFVSAWNYTYDKIFSTINNAFISPLIDETTTDNWQTLIHEQLNIACRSFEIDERAELVDIEQHTSKIVNFNQGQNGRLVAINKNTVRAFYVYDDSTVSFDLLNGTKKVLGAGKGYESVSFSLQLGSFNQSTEELYIPNRVMGNISVIKDTIYAGNPSISLAYIINGTQSLVVRGTHFGFLQGTSKITIDGTDLGKATYWSNDSVYFENNSHVIPGNLILTVLERTASETLLPVEITLFTVDANATGVKLKWTTATEINNYGFEVERRRVVESLSSDVDELKQWTKIGFVSGSGTSNAPHEYNYLDQKLTDGRYLYRLKQIDNDGSFKYSMSVEVDNNLTPTVFSLTQNFPNPFNPSTTISFDLPRKSFVSLKVFDLIGREIASIISEDMPAGSYTKQWNASNLTSGVYFYRLQAGLFIETKKLVLLR